MVFAPFEMLWEFPKGCLVGAGIQRCGPSSGTGTALRRKCRPGSRTLPSRSGRLGGSGGAGNPGFPWRPSPATALGQGLWRPWSGVESADSPISDPGRPCHHGRVTAYVIAESPHLDTPEVRRYRELAKASITRYGGRYLVRGALPDAFEGDWSPENRMVIIEFPSLEQARNWYTSPEYAQARAARSDISGRRMLFVEGLGKQQD